MLSKSQPNRWQRNQNTVRHTIGSKQFGPVAHTVVVVVLLCVMGLMYLSQINKTNAYTYPVNELETKRDALVTEQQQLKVEAARLASLEAVRSSSVARAMGNPEAVHTIR